MDGTQILGSHVPYGVFHGMEGSLVWTLGLLEYFQLCSHFCVKIHRLGHLAGSDKGLSGDAAGDLGARGHMLSLFWGTPAVMTPESSVRMSVLGPTTL